MQTYMITWKSHCWAYLYDWPNRERLIQQIYRDSRKPEGGFPLQYVLQAIREIRG